MLQKSYPFIGLAAALLILGAVALSIRSYKPSPAGVATSTPVQGVSVEDDASSTVVIPVPTTQPPKLMGAIVISASSTLTVDQQALMRSKIEALIAQLKAAPTRADLWLQLGVDRKIVGDYQGAAEAWQYVAATGGASLNYVAYGNLGDLYLYFTKDGPKAEANYKKAIALKPHVIDYYRGLYTLYRYDYKVGTSAAADILAQGLKVNPNNPDLLQLQAQLKAQ